MTGSIFINFILKVYATLNHFYENSVSYKLVSKICNLCKESPIATFFYNLFCVNSKTKYSEGSIFFKLLYSFLEVIFTYTKKILYFFYNSLEGGFFHSLICSFITFVKNNIKLVCYTLIIAIVVTAFISLKLSALIVIFSFFIFTFFNLEWAIGLFIIGMSIFPHSLWNNTYIFLASLFFAFVFFLQVVFEKRQANIHLTSPALIIYIIMIFLSLFISRDFMDSLRISLILFSSILISIILTNVITSKEVLINFIKFLAVAGFLTSTYGIIKYVFGIEVRYDFIDINVSGGAARLFSTMDNPNNFAEFLILVIPVSSTLILACDTDLKRLFFALLVVPCILALVLTLSRASYIAFAVALFIFIFIANKRILPFFIILFIACIPFLPSYIIDRILTIGKDSSSSFRLLIWEGAYQTLIRNWFFGLGIGPVAFGKVFKIYVDPVAAPAMHSHNLLLQIWIETGIGGFISFIVVCFTAFKNGVVKAINTKDVQYKFILCGLACTIPAILFFGMVEHVWYYPRIMLTFWIIIGILCAATNLKEDGGQTCESSTLN